MAAAGGHETHAEPGATSSGAPLLCFSDIDGTLVHYEDMEQFGEFVQQPDHANLTLWQPKDCAGCSGAAPVPVLRLPPSHTGSQGTIGVGTLQRIARLRERGAVFVLVTGGRLTTLLQRLPFLPAADAYVCESGGRIFYPSTSGDLPTACPLVEDLAWRRQHNAAAGPASQEWLRPDERSGSLWDAFRALKAGGWQPDCASYTTAFRLRLLRGRSAEELQAAVSGLPPGLATSLNLGCLDVYPGTSGKRAAGAYLLARFRVAPDRAVLLCDDDNDMGLAGLVSRAFLPALSSDSIRAAAAAAPDKFVTSDRGAVLATEHALQRVQALLDAHLGAAPPP